jgi:hypothetical protein
VRRPGRYERKQIVREKNLIVRIGASPLCFSGHRLRFALRRGHYTLKKKKTHNTHTHTHMHVYGDAWEGALPACMLRCALGGRRLLTYGLGCAGQQMRRG